MQDLNDLYYFVQIVEHGGFAAAGRALGMPKSRLSRRLALLEQRLDVRLIQRSTRQFQVTEPGRLYYSHCKAMLIEAEAAQAAVERLQLEPSGLIRLSCPVTLLQVHVSAMLAGFMQRYPQVRIELEATNRRVDVLAEGLDLAIRVRPPPLADSELVLRVLADRGQCLVASPELVQQRGAVTEPQQLSAWPSLGLGSSQQSFVWQLFGPGGVSVQVPHQPRLMTTDMVSLRAAAIAGLGVVQLPRLMLTEAFTEGTLVRLLPDWSPQPELIHLVFPSRRGLLPSVRALIDFLAARFAELDED